MRNTTALLAAALTLFGAALSPLAHGQSTPIVLVDDPGVRQLATATARPTYPADAENAKATGVAVGQFLIEPNGSVGSLKILQAPNPAIADAMLHALKQWRFRPLPAAYGPGARVRGTVIYYFLMQHGKPAVLSPAEAPVIGPTTRKHLPGSPASPGESNATPAAARASRCR